MRYMAYKYTCRASSSVSCSLSDVNFSRIDLSINEEDSAPSALAIKVLCSELTTETLNSAAARSVWKSNLNKIDFIFERVE